MEIYVAGYRFNDFRETRWRKNQGDNARRRFRISSKGFPPKKSGPIYSEPSLPSIDTILSVNRERR